MQDIHLQSSTKVMYIVNYKDSEIHELQALTNIMYTVTIYSCDNLLIVDHGI